MVWFRDFVSVESLDTDDGLRGRLTCSFFLRMWTLSVFYLRKDV
jgi:hypothetical protein